MREREERRSMSVSQWAFVDTKKFKADVMTCTENCMNNEMENCAQFVLHLFSYCRHTSKLQDPDNDRFPCTSLLQKNWGADLCEKESDKLMFTEKHMQCLQNVQDAAHNSPRHKLGEDALQRVAEPFCGDCPASCEEEFADEDEEEIDGLQEDDCNNLMEQIAPDDRDNFDEDPALIPAKMQNFSFKFQRHKGKDRCGCDDDLNVATSTLEDDEEMLDDFVCHGVVIPQETSDADPDHPRSRIAHSMKQIVTMHLSRTSTHARAKVFKRNKDAQVLEANGSLNSIQDWAKAAQLDRKQKRAFESLIAAFFLTFLEEANDDETQDDAEVTTVDCVKFHALKKALQKLMGAHVETRRDGDQLMCLIHGPGGSGESTVVNLVIACAQECCDLSGHPFASRAIVVTAMSGVAACLLQGETTHSSLALMRTAQN